MLLSQESSNIYDTLRNETGYKNNKERILQTLEDGTGIECLEAIVLEYMNRTYTESDRSAEDTAKGR